MSSPPPSNFSSLTSLSSTPTLPASIPPMSSFNESPPSFINPSGRSSSSSMADSFNENLHTSSSSSIHPQLMSIQEMETLGTPTSSPLMRPASGRFVGGMKRLLRIPSGGQAGVATSSVQAEVPSMASLEHHDELDKNHRIFRKVMKQIKHPRPVTLTRLRRRPVHRKHTGNRPRERHHYSDDGYTSDPGLLREVNQVTRDEDQEEEDDTESGDREGERAERIARLRTKLDKYKRLLQDEEIRLQDVQNEYVQGMVESVTDKDQHRLKKNFISKQGKAKDEIEALKRKVDHYEEQLQYLQQGGEISLSRQFRYTHKVKDQFNKFKQFGGMKSGIRMLKKMKPGSNGHQSVDLEDEELEDDINPTDDIESASQASFANGQMDKDDDDEHSCVCCVNDYNTVMDTVNKQKHVLADMQQKYNILATKLEQEREKSERLEGELNTLTDLHQNGVIELRGQLAQMERLTFSKNQDLEDNIENCQSRLHKLEVQITNSADRSEAPATIGMARKVGVPALSYLLNFVSVCVKLSGHIGRKGFLAVFIVIIAIVTFYVLYQ